MKTPTREYLETLSTENAAILMRECSKIPDHDGNPDSVLSIVDNVTLAINFMTDGNNNGIEIIY